VGERQRQQKKVCRPSFSNSACLETFLEAIKQETVTLAERWRTEDGRRIAVGGSRRGRDLYEEARRLTLDIVLRVTFGARIERSDELSDVIGEFITQTVNVANEVPPWWAVGASLSYRKVQVRQTHRAFDDMVGSARNAAYRDGLTSEFWWGPFVREQRSLPVIREIIVDIVQQRREQLGGEAAVRDGDLLGELLMEADGRAMSDDGACAHTASDARRFPSPGV
jgi:hypothetical protein